MSDRGKIYSVIEQQVRESIANEPDDVAVFLLTERLIEARCKIYDLECEIAELEQAIEVTKEEP